MATVWIPALLRSLTNNADRISAGGATVADVIADLDRQFPGLQSRLIDGDHLRSGLVAIVDGNVARSGIDEPVGDTSEVHFVHAIGGGSAR